MRCVDGLLRFISRSIVHLPEVYGFATLAGFEILKPSTDSAVLAELIKSPEFEDLDTTCPRRPRRSCSSDGCSETGSSRNQLARGNKVRVLPMDRRPRPGPFFVSEIHVGSYKLMTGAHARAVLDEWARDYEEPSAEVSAQLERQIYTALDAPRVYSLVEMGEATEWPGVYGLWAYCEFAAIDHDQRRLSLVVAAYD